MSGIFGEDPLLGDVSFLHINAGAGGGEACDWASMLLRMYRRWAERHGRKFSLVSIEPGGIGGCRSATARIDGTQVLGSEVGVHRLVRLSPFDSQHRRHTSFATVQVVPGDLIDPTEPVRSYVMQPYKMVKDHRTGAETDDVTAVLDGDIHDLIIASP